MHSQQIVYSVPESIAVNKCVLATVCMLFTITAWVYGLELQSGVTVCSYNYCLAAHDSKLCAAAKVTCVSTIAAMTRFLLVL